MPTQRIHEKLVQDGVDAIVTSIEENEKTLGFKLAAELMIQTNIAGLQAMGMLAIADAIRYASPVS